MPRDSRAITEFGSIVYHYGDSVSILHVSSSLVFISIECKLEKKKKKESMTIENSYCYYTRQTKGNQRSFLFFSRKPTETMLGNREEAQRERSLILIFFPSLFAAGMFLFWRRKKKTRQRNQYIKQSKYNVHRWISESKRAFSESRRRSSALPLPCPKMRRRKDADWIRDLHRRNVIKRQQRSNCSFGRNFVLRWRHYWCFPTSLVL